MIWLTLVWLWLLAGAVGAWRLYVDDRESDNPADEFCDYLLSRSGIVKVTLVRVLGGAITLMCSLA